MKDNKYKTLMVEVKALRAKLAILEERKNSTNEKEDVVPPQSIDDIRPDPPAKRAKRVAYASKP